MFPGILIFLYNDYIFMKWPRWSNTRQKDAKFQNFSHTTSNHFFRIEKYFATLNILTFPPAILFRLWTGEADIFRKGYTSWVRHSWRWVSRRDSARCLLRRTSRGTLSTRWSRGLVCAGATATLTSQRLQGGLCRMLIRDCGRKTRLGTSAEIKS